MFYRHFGDCGVADPSWMELKHFLNFLNAQFEDCENSTFCNVEHTGYVLPGFKAFVVKFMLKMSKVSSFLNLKFKYYTLQYTCIIIYKNNNYEL